MKKIIILILIAALNISIGSINVNAQAPEQLTEQQIAEFLQSEGLFEGTDNGFELDKTLTRAEMCVLISRLYDDLHNPELRDFYKDVPKEHWAYKDIVKVAMNGLVHGYGDELLGPDDYITGEQLATILVRATGYDLIRETTVPWYESFMETASENGILENVEFELNTPITRGQAITMFYNALHLPMVRWEKIIEADGKRIPVYDILDGTSEDKPLTTLYIKYKMKFN